MPRGGRVRPAQAEPVHEVVDVGQMVPDVAAAEDDEAAPRDAAKELQQPPIAGAVDPGRPHHHELDAGVRGRAPRHALPFELRLLVDVTRAQGRILVGRRVGDVAVDADGAAVDDALDAGRAGGFDQGADRGRVDRAIEAVVESSGAVQRGDVVDDVDAGDGARERRHVGEVAGRQLDTGQCRRRHMRVADQRAHRDAIGGEAPGQVSAGEPGRARHEDAPRRDRLGHHASRSATRVTGEPISAVTPMARRAPSLAPVNPRADTALCSAIGRTKWR